MIRPRRLRRRLVPLAAGVVAVLALVGFGAVWTDAFGVGERFDPLLARIELAIHPPPDRPIEALVRVTPPPSDEPTAAPATPMASGEASVPPATASPTPVRAPVDITLLTDPEAHFITELDNEWCAVSGTQIVLNIWDRAPVTKAFQRELAGRIGEWESRRDSHNGGWGPSAIVLALEAYGVDGYEVRGYDRRQDAMRDAAVAISTYHAPVLLLAWKGAHTWVMTGYRADADPTLFPDARVSGAYILDPWYPRVSSIWGPSDPPGTFQDWNEIRRNYLEWARPEGRYPDRDGLFIAVVPTQPGPGG